MNISALLVDDDPNCIGNLKDALQSFPYVHIVGELNYPHEVIRFLQNHHVDLLFLDIEMGTANGLDIARHISKLYPAIAIIFVTGHTDFALRAFELYPIDYLIKPINIFRLESALNKVQERLRPNMANKEEKICVRVAGGIRILPLEDILYMEKRGRKVLIHCVKEGEIPSQESMKQLELIFSPYGFFRTHQSFIVSTNKIKSIYPDAYSRSYSIELHQSQITLPLSRNYYPQLRDILQKRGLSIY